MAIRFVSSHVIFHSTCEAETRCVRLLFPNARIFQFPNLIELPPLKRRQPAQYLLYVGRLHPIKALDQLIRAAHLSRPFRQQNWRLLLAGPDQHAYADQLKQLANELEMNSRISFMGEVTGERKQHLYANARVTILPSHSENFGFVVTESLAQGTPVIASTGTPWQLLETEKAGIWTANDPVSLAHALDRFLTMPAYEYAMYRRQALRVVRGQFDVQTHSNRWKTFYRHLLHPTPCKNA